MEWINRLFYCMTEFYGDKWISKFTKDFPIDLLKIIWQSAMTGLTEEEIRNSLRWYKKEALIGNKGPPNQIEFFMRAKRLKINL